MHDYAIFGHNRSTIGRWLGVASIICTSVISSFISWFNQLELLPMITSVAVTTSAVYFLFHLIFNKYGWKNTVLKLPNLNGVWKVIGFTLDENSNVKYNWEAEIDIEQTWEHLVICQKTKNSRSNSYTATLSKLGGTNGGWLLSYSYRNEPNANQFHELNSHKGFCEILLDKELKTGDASYFNSNGRRTFGTMKLERISND